MSPRGPRREPAAPLPLCGHGIPALPVAGTAVCPACRSFWDLGVLRTRYRYDGSYPGSRGHHDPDVGNLKVRTLRRHLALTGIHLAGRNVCEVGFGGGQCLAFMAGKARNSAGIESTPENIDHAADLGLGREFLYLHDQLPATLPFSVDLWVFLDSFEHLGDPEEFLTWLSRNSGESAGVLLVAPDGGSLSARLMGRHWFHRLPDHPFHWTKEGLTHLFDRHGFGLVRSFYPWKYVSLGMIFSHARMMILGRPRKVSNRRRSFADLPVWLNAGEMGLVFRKRCA